MAVKPAVKRAVLVTGVSTGLGLATSKELLQRGFHVYGSVRKQADAERLSKQLGTSFTPLLFDVTDAPAIRHAAEVVRAALAGQRLAALINNAGISMTAPLEVVPLEAVRSILETNLVGTLAVTQAFLPLLGTDRSLKGAPGRIIMVSSITARGAMPLTGPYAASKLGLEALSEALRRELRLFGIPVVVMSVGPVPTAIQDKVLHSAAERQEVGPYMPMLARWRTIMQAMSHPALAMSAEECARTICDAVEAWWPRARYVPISWCQWPAQLLPEWLPACVADLAVALMFGTRRLR